MSTPSFRLFAQACLGVVVGVLLAVAIARIAFPADGRPTAVPDGLLSWTLPNIWLKPREKGFYVLALALGGNVRLFRDLQNLASQGNGSKSLVDAHCIGAGRQSDYRAHARRRVFSHPWTCRARSRGRAGDADMQKGRAARFDRAIFRRSARRQSEALALFCHPRHNDPAVDSFLICGRRGKSWIEPSSRRLRDRSGALFFRKRAASGTGLLYAVQHRISVAFSLCHGAIGRAGRSCLRDRGYSRNMVVLRAPRSSAAMALSLVDRGGHCRVHTASLGLCLSV